jgi:hypothetical protein
MAYVICANLAEPSPYPWCKVQGGRSYGWLGLVENIKGERVFPEPQPMWASKDGGPVPLEWQPQSVLRADYVPRNDNAPYNPDISFVRGGTPCLSASARKMIEDLEPGVHQWFPVDIFNADGTIREPRRYMLNVCQLVDAIEDGYYVTSPNGARTYSGGSFYPLKIRRQDVAGLHLWRDRRANFEDLFVSDALYGRIVENNYGAFDLGVATEV